MRARVVEVVTGSQLWFEGELVEVRELRSDTIVLQSGGALRTVLAREVLLNAAPLNVDPHPAESDPAAAANLVLSNLTGRDRQNLETRLQAVAAVMALCETGTTTRGACEQLEASMPVSSRTLRRWVTAYTDAGPAGLVDSRVASQRSCVDSRWDEACLAVLREFVSASTPTIDVVIDRTNRRVVEAHGESAVA